MTDVGKSAVVSLLVLLVHVVNPDGRAGRIEGYASAVNHVIGTKAHMAVTVLTRLLAHVLSSTTLHELSLLPGPTSTHHAAVTGF